MELETELYVARRIGEISTHFSDYTRLLSPEKVKDAFDEIYRRFDDTMKEYSMNYTSIEMATLVLDAMEESFSKKYKEHKDVVH